MMKKRKMEIRKKSAVNRFIFIDGIDELITNYNVFKISILKLY